MNNLKPIVDQERPKVYIETYGCQMNVNDSEVILSILQKNGYALTENMDRADVILANTCSIRDNAEQRIWGRIEQFRLQKKRNPQVVIGIVGCMAERLKDKLLEKVDLVAGPDAYRSLPALLRDIRPDSPQINVLLSREETYADISPVRLDRNGVSAYISIMRGCNNVCSYCVVPYTRGAERSRDPHSIVREARELFENGYKEVNLLGQNVDSYLWKECREGAAEGVSAGDAEEGEVVNFARLLEMVAAISPELRVRFSTSHPKDISDEVISTIAAHENICRHIHLPVQSGSSRILEKMRRKYDREWYLERVAKIREVMPDCGLSTDVIAGFCSETEQDHQDTLSLFEQVCFDSAFMFQYSERPGTLASRHYPDDVPPEVKTARLNEIIALQTKMSLRSNQKDMGKTFKVLIEGPSKRNPDDLCGRAGNNKMCVFPSMAAERATQGLAPLGAGNYVNVKVVDCTSATLICEIV
ncbi:MAG: tRNA (N6-isopentenyl adenosine(37)-C2)-methylthiotransferase MiaB [Candidatus Cryptobacteroides sp.]|nr:tRNA (N6-isopentenyl adenosine(37)-C2)-methylthiotransferase MiaB [Bacteroidales bacterium]MDD7132872.1 tRNA (N6-isopentenyl adenosine(37)-C2)-methylthiotransferase MiaB [Bacteroidales bacterium]MDY2774334.1 tRNA (N6-isopentenyl adenosine(37)-C2)-methylthiotransferase MiaB [Candidatus Cryptobacteroides sp.]